MRLMAAAASSEGSSPRVRGTLDGSGRLAADAGIIPACAGNTHASVPRRPPTRDHPRVCGEHRRVHMEGLPGGGSSPRVRGTHLDQTLSLNLGGIIPACAGNTLPGAGRVQPHRDHPRVCGEHPWRGLSRFLVLGSSPRVRGTLCAAMISSCITGIIPACAGNTCLRSSCRLSSRDHPRVCGEHPVVPWSICG